MPAINPRSRKKDCNFSCLELVDVQPGERAMRSTQFLKRENIFGKKYGKNEEVENMRKTGFSHL